MPSATPTSVWLIEDNAVFRGAVARALRRCEDIASVEDFSNGEDALAALEKASPAVVLMDLGLPGMNGLEAIEKIKTLSPTTAVLVLTVFEDEEKIFRAISAGASGYLLKSPTVSEIVDSVRVVLAGGSPMTPRIARRVLEMFTKLTPKPPTTNISAREREILGILARGLSKKEIATQLGISIHTVDMHLRRTYTKLHVNTAAGAVAKALRDGLVESP